LLVPRKVWFVQIGWQLKNAEPADYTLKIYRFIGVLILIDGFFRFLRLTFHP
jgi:hypothetical protein